MKLAIIGTRGIPNHYGGFEQFAEYLSVRMVELGHDITVYNSHNHPFSGDDFNGVKIVHCFDPEYKIGTVGQFFYDYNCIKDTRKKDFDIILQLGYTSSTIWGRLLPKKAIVITNMDGLEWKRTKFSKPVRRFIKYAEKLAVKFSDVFVSDSLGIQEYLKKTYKIDSTYIPYGAHCFHGPSVSEIEAYDVVPYEYNMLVARLEPENSIEIILNGVAKSKTQKTFLVIGNHKTKYGQYLKDKFAQYNHIRFIGGVYNISVLNNLRYFSNLYFHGHTVGGTNPSLLEAMASNALICANDNGFNRSILENDAFYFKNEFDVASKLDEIVKSEFTEYVDNNFNKVDQIYNWEKIIQQYLECFNNALQTVKK